MVNAKEYEEIRKKINRLKQILDYLISNGKSSYIEQGYIPLNEEALSLRTELKQNHFLEYEEFIFNWLTANNWLIDYADGDSDTLALVYSQRD